MGGMEAGIVTKPLREFTEKVDDVYLDFDETISTDKLSMHIRNIFCATTNSSICPCGKGGGIACDDPDAMVKAIETLPNKGLPNITRSIGGEPKAGYMKIGRQAAMKSWLGRLRKAINGRVFIMSTSWYPVSAIQWKNFILYVSKKVEFGFDAEHVLSIADPGPGLASDKGSVIKANMKKTGATFEKAIFADDSAGNIKSAKDVCNTLHVSKRLGIDDTDRDYIEALVSGCKVGTSAATTIRVPFMITAALSFCVLLKNLW